MLPLHCFPQKFLVFLIVLLFLFMPPLLLPIVHLTGFTIFYKVYQLEINYLLALILFGLLVVSTHKAVDKGESYWYIIMTYAFIILCCFQSGKLETFILLSKTMTFVMSFILCGWGIYLLNGNRVTFEIVLTISIMWAFYFKFLLLYEPVDGSYWANVESYVMNMLL